jgi:hypothetical protein
MLIVASSSTLLVQRALARRAALKRERETATG